MYIYIYIYIYTEGATKNFRFGEELINFIFMQSKTDIFIQRDSHCLILDICHAQRAITLHYFQNYSSK